MKARFVFILLLIINCLACSRNTTDNRSSAAWRARARIMFDPLGVERVDKPVVLALDFSALLSQAGLEGRLDERHIRLVEVDSTGTVIDSLVPFQFDRNRDNTTAGGALTFIVEGITQPNKTRLYDFYFDTEDNRAGKQESQFESIVSITDEVMHEEQISIKINTPSATWYYHKAGAGFASLEDRDGVDWISYRPCCESGGEYRGIPNMWKFHPGLDSCRSVVEADGPLRVRIRSVSLDGRWECVWDIFPHYALMTLEKAGGNYWFLYEGTPGGTLDVDRDYNVLSNGIRRSVSEDWHGDIPAPEWLYFGDESKKRVLYLVHHEDDEHSDQFWQMREEMVVFGFGRQYRCCDTYMSEVPAYFTVGFSEDSSFASVQKAVNNASKPVKIEVLKLEKISTHKN